MHPLLTSAFHQRSRKIGGLALAILFGAAVSPGLGAGQTNDYQIIATRNLFGLRTNNPVVEMLPAAVDPKEDLLLTGLADVYGHRTALFTMLEPGKAPSHFTLSEGEENEWLAVKAVHVREGTVQTRLKKPVARVHEIATETLLSFDAHGLKTIFAQTPGMPLR